MPERKQRLAGEVKICAFGADDVVIADVAKVLRVGIPCYGASSRRGEVSEQASCNRRAHGRTSMADMHGCAELAGIEGIRVSRNHIQNSVFIDL